MLIFEVLSVGISHDLGMERHIGRSAPSVGRSVGVKVGGADLASRVDLIGVMPMGHDAAMGQLKEGMGQLKEDGLLASGG
jgi:hypothetical protein